MTDIAIDQVRDELRRLASDGGFGQMVDAIDAHLAKASDYERAVTEQAMLTECVSVTGRDPSDVIRDVIQWHVSNAAQPAAVGDNWPYGVGIYGPANMKTNLVSQGDDAAANSEAIGRILAYADDLTARDSRCARAAWEKELEALMSRSPFANKALSPAQPVDAVDVSIVQDWKWCPKCGKRWGEDVHGTDDFSVCAGCDHDAKLAHPHPAVPDGYQLVPVEPTAAMIWDMAKVGHDNGDAGLSADKFYTLIYKAMLAAAPDGEVA